MNGLISSGRITVSPKQSAFPFRSIDSNENIIGTVSAEREGRLKMVTGIFLTVLNVQVISAALRLIVTNSVGILSCFENMIYQLVE